MIRLLIATILAVSMSTIFGCATGPVGNIVQPAPPMPSTLLAPSQADTVLFMGVDIGSSGTTLGGHYDGWLKVFQHSLSLTPDLKSTWNDWTTREVLSALREAGYFAKSSPSLFRETRASRGAGFALAGEITSLRFNTYGSTGGYKSEATVGILWELMDFDEGSVVFEKRISASSTTTGNSGDAFLTSIRSIAAQLLANRHFRAAFVPPATPPVVTSESAVSWRRPLPLATDIIEVIPADLNPVGDDLRAISLGVVSLRGLRAGGSAFLLTRDGLALTNLHVIDENPKLHAIFHDRRESSVRLVRSNRESDTALVQIDCRSDCVTIGIGRSTDVRVGDDLAVIGTPLSQSLSQTITKGILSGRRLGNGVTLLQTDAAVSPGNSGGPIIDTTTGLVVGVATSKIVNDGVEGIGFGVAIEDALRVLGVMMPR